MNRKIFLFFVAALAFLSVRGQEFTDYIKKKAVRINRLDSLSNDIYKQISAYQLIMIGEMHGTNEPAKLVTGLTELMTRNGDSVQVGFEISSEDMTDFLTEHSDSSIVRSDFFSKRSLDGRACFAWADAIRLLNKNPSVKIFFYDVNDGDCKSYLERDSIMYLKLKERIRKKPRWKTITLGGNVHNMLLPFKGRNKMALYLRLDMDLNLSDKMCSLNHYYQSGTMLNNTGKGLQLRKVEDFVTDYSSSVDYDNYLLLYPSNAIDSYTGALFTRYVTASKLVTEK